MMEPTSDVFNRAYARNWSGLLKRLKTHPQDAAWFSKSKGAALHIACMRKPPPEVIEALVAVYPDAAWINSGRNQKGGSIPLLLACSHGASYEALRIILVATPTSAIGYREERSYYCRDRELPLDYLFAYYARQYGRDFCRVIRSSAYLRGKEGEFWQKAALLLDHGRRHNPNSHPLEPTNPVLILQADASLKSNYIYTYSWSFQELVTRLVSKVPTLISKRAGTSDEDGQFLLHTAIHSGLGWESGIGEILTAAPWVVSLRDSRTGLLPFALAASVATDGNDSLTVVWRLLLENPSLLCAPP